MTRRRRGGPDAWPRMKRRGRGRARMVYVSVGPRMRGLADAAARAGVAVNGVATAIAAALGRMHAMDKALASMERTTRHD